MQVQEVKEEVGVQMRLGQVLPLPSVQAPSLLLLSSGNHTPNNTAVPTSNPCDSLYLQHPMVPLVMEYLMLSTYRR